MRSLELTDNNYGAFWQPSFHFSRAYQLHLEIYRLYAGPLLFQFLGVSLHKIIEINPCKNYTIESIVFNKNVCRKMFVKTRLCNF